VTTANWRRFLIGLGIFGLIQLGLNVAQVAQALGGALKVLTLKSGVTLETLSEQLHELRDAIVGELRAARAPL